MRTVVTSCWLLALLVMLDRSALSQEADQPTLRVLCYNIHYGQGTDGKYDIPRLASVIAAAKPDLVALQEVDVGVKRSGRVHQVQRLGELTDMHARYGPTQHFQGGLYGNAVLSRFPIENVVIHPLPYTESTAKKQTYPRGAIEIVVKMSPHQSVRFISTHFQHNLASDRVEQAKAINQLFANDDSLPSILAGDMNATPDSEPIQILESKWTGAIDAAATPTAPAPTPRSRIDYVFFRPNNALKVTRSEVVAEPTASDHRPVLAVFELREQVNANKQPLTE